MALYMVISAPLRAIIEGGSSVRWGSTETVTVNGSLSYDGDIGPYTHTGISFTWYCRDSVENASMSNDCFGAFVALKNVTPTIIGINTRLLTVAKKYVLTLTISKDVRSSSVEMSFEIATGEIPQVVLR